MRRWLGQVCAWLVIMAAGSALLAAVVVPRLSGATPYAVLTGSMSPTYPPGTLVVVEPVDVSDVSPGDVVTYQLRSGESAVATHRVVSTGFAMTGDRVLVTQGDANDRPDPAPVIPAQIRGRVWYSVPYLGYVHNAIGGDQRQQVITVAAGGLIAYATFMFASSVRDRRRRATAPEAVASRTLRRCAVRATVATGVLTVVLSVAVPAGAADEIGLSRDGVTWSSALASPLFDERLLWVPGDIRTATFWVRNQGPTAATVTIRFRADDVDELLSRRDLDVAVRMNTGPWNDLAADDHAVGFDRSNLARDETVRIEVRVAFDPASTNRSFSRVLPIGFTATLSEAAGDEPARGDLAWTGSGHTAVALWSAAGLVAGGWIVLAAVRRRTRRA